MPYRANPADFFSVSDFGIFPRFFLGGLVGVIGGVERERASERQREQKMGGVLGGRLTATPQPVPR